MRIGKHSQYRLSLRPLQERSHAAIDLLAVEVSLQGAEFRSPLETPGQECQRPLIVSRGEALQEAIEPRRRLGGFCLVLNGKQLVELPLRLGKQVIQQL